MDRPWFARVFTRSYFLYKRLVEDPFAALVSRHPRWFADGHIIDVGANIGYTATVFARALSPGYQVHAFEPDTTNYQLLLRTIDAHRLDQRIIATRAAVGDRDGLARLWRNDRHHGDHRIVTPAFQDRADTVTEVPMVTIDAVVEQRGLRPGTVGFVKIDVQGYELAVCRGMVRTMEDNPRAILAVEYSPGEMVELGFEPSVLLQHLVDSGFTLYILRRDGTFAPTTMTRLLRDQAPGDYLDLLCARTPLS